MKMKSKFIYLFPLLVGLFLSHSISSSSEIDPHPAIEIPIFREGYNVEKFYDSSKETKSVTYQIQTTNPPAEVLEFYDAYFNGSGWRSAFEICQRNWEGLADGPRTGVAHFRQLFASWEHPEMNLKAVLWLTYEAGNKASQNEAVVKCEIQPKTGK
jgi:hypothetical protein